MNVYLEQGTLPSRTTQDHRYRTSGTYTFDQFLLNQTLWPWQPGETYYLTATNTGSTVENFTFVLNGSLAAEEPTNLSASDGAFSNLVDISWTAVYGASTYDLWRSETNDLLTAERIASAIYSGYDDQGVTAGLRYYYWATVAGQTNTSWFSASDGGWISGAGSLASSQQFVPAAGSSETLAVTAQAETNWTAKANDYWITIQSGHPGQGLGTVAYSVSPYAGELSRVGTITVAQQHFTVTQAGFGVPGNVQATDGDFMDRTELTWDPLVGATRYYIYRNSTDTTVGAAYQGNVTTNAFSDSSGVLDQPYFYWVRPLSAGGLGGFSTSDSGFRSAGGVAAAWIALHFPGGYPGNGVDSDGDGFDNLAEYIAGTLPTDPASVFKVVDTESIPAGFVLSWNVITGRQYAVHWTADLVSGFLPLVTNLVFPVGSYTDTVHTVEEAGFYFIDVQLED